MAAGLAQPAHFFFWAMFLPYIMPFFSSLVKDLFRTQGTNTGNDGVAAVADVSL